MSTVHEITDAVRRLPPDDLAAFRAWFAEYDAKVWDRELDADIAAGRLDVLAEEALNALRRDRWTHR